MPWDSRRRRTPLMVLLVAAGLLAGCSGAEDADRAFPASAGGSATSSPPPEPQVYVAVGASETVGVGADDPASEAWPTVLREAALPGSTFVNVGVSGATARGALADQVPRALAAEPDVVTVWLAVNDIVTLVPVASYERTLQRLVHRLRKGGETDVLVGNVPDLWRLPAYLACLPESGRRDVPCVLPLVPAEADVRATVAAFNAVIERVVRDEGAELVDLSREDDLAGLTSSDGFHPSTAGHREVASAFAGALER